jgi:hypothetical protein
MSSDGQQEGPSGTFAFGGEAGKPQDPTNDIFVAGVILLSIASYNVVEVLIWILSTFRHFRGLYFYSVLITDISLMGFIGLSFLMLYIGCSPGWPAGLWGIVCAVLQTAQILILYTRLHLVCPHNPGVVRAVRILIVITCIVLIPLLVISGIYASVTPSWVATCGIITRSVRITVTVREMAVCAIYCLQAFRELSTIAAHKGRAGEKVMQQLIAVQLAINLMDIALLALTFGSPMTIQLGYTSLVYAIKLKMEFAILNTLKTLLTSPTEFLPSSRMPEPQPSCIPSSIPTVNTVRPNSPPPRLRPHPHARFFHPKTGSANSSRVTALLLSAQKFLNAFIRRDDNPDAPPPLSPPTEHGAQALISVPR